MDFSTNSTIVLILSLRRPKAQTWVRICWRKCKVLLIAALTFDLFIGILGYFIWQLQSITWLLIHCSLVIPAIVYILFSKRFTINIAEFPEALPEK
jgi:hypothetical protein